MKTRKLGSYLAMLVVVLLASFFIMNKSVEAATEGNFSYRIDSRSGEAVITSYNADEIHCVVPATLGGKTVGHIGGNAFAKKTYMQTITLPNTIKSIDYQAFLKSTALKSIVIPDSVTSLSYRIFSGCTALERVVIGSGVKSLPDGLFVDCSSLSSVTLPYGLEKICGRTGYYGPFQSCTSLKSITIPSTVTSIGEFAFCKSGLTSITIPDSVTSIGYKSFSECPNLEKVVVGSGIKTLTREAFSHNPVLKTVQIRGNTLDSIEYDCFPGCVSLTSINIPASLSSIGKYTFKNCYALKSITLNEGLATIDSYAFLNSGLTELTIPKSVKWLGNRIVEDCNSLSKVTIKANILDGNQLQPIIGETGAQNLVISCYANSQYLSNLTDNAERFNYTVQTMTPVKASAISLNPVETGVYVDETTKISYALSPANATDSVKYVSSNTKIATVNQHGVVTGVAKGTVTITAETNEGVIAQATVVVNQYPKSVTFSTKSKSMKVGETASLPAKVDYGDRNDVTVKYTSSNPRVATVDGAGNVKAIAPGTATITASVYNGLTDTVTITVAYSSVKKVSFSTSKKTMAVKQKLTMKAKIDNGTRTDLKITYKSSNKKVAAVNSSGKITAKKAGTAYITATAGGKSGRIKITVKKAPSKIKFKKKSVTIKRKKSTTLKYTLTKNTYTYKLTWKSSNKKIATVNSKGKVTGKKKGTCKITVKTHNGKKATIKVKVK